MRTNLGRKFPPNSPNPEKTTMSHIEEATRDAQYLVLAAEKLCVTLYKIPIDHEQDVSKTVLDCWNSASDAIKTARDAAKQVEKLKSEQDRDLEQDERNRERLKSWRKRWIRAGMELCTD